MVVWYSPNVPQKSDKSKPGPDPECLKIEGDPEEALQKLVTTPPPAESEPKSPQGRGVALTRADAIEATIAHLHILFPRWRIKDAGDPDGQGERFKLFDDQDRPRHILGLTAELLTESESPQSLSDFLNEHQIKRHLADAGTKIVWLGTDGYFD